MDRTKAAVPCALTYYVLRMHEKHEKHEKHVSRTPYHTPASSPLAQCQ